MNYVESLIQLFAGEIGEITVCTVPQTFADAVGAKTRFARLSSQTIYKQRKNHSELSATEYLMLPMVMSDGLVLLEGKDKDEPRIHFSYQYQEGKRYLATMKATYTGQRLYIVRFHRARARHTKTLVKRSEILRTAKIY